MEQLQMPRGTEKREPYYIVATSDHSVRLAVADMLLAEKAPFCLVERLPQLVALLEEVLRQITVIDLAPWGTDLARALAEHAADQGRCACICLVTESQMAEIRAAEWAGRLHLVARERLQADLPAVLRRCAEAQHMYRRMEELLQLEHQSLYNTLSKEAEGMKLEDMNIFKKPMTRRSFLKGAAATAAAAGVAMSGGMKLLAPAEAAPGETGGGDQIFYGSCRGNCFQGCHIKYKVRNGKVVATEMAEFPDPRYNRICLKGLSLPQRIYSPTRIRYPMKQTGERGSDNWERITWDEAIEIIGSKWESLIERYGDKKSIALTSTSGNSGFTTLYMMKLGMVLGAASITSSVDNAFFKGLIDTVGTGSGFNSNDLSDLPNAKTVVLWGLNITEAQLQHWHFIAEAKENGAKIICIDPNYTLTAAKSDIHVPIRQGTDSALAMAMIHYVLENGWQDEEYLKKATVAPFLVKEENGQYLRKSDLESLAEGETDDFVIWDSDTNAYGYSQEVANQKIRGSYTIKGIKVNTAFDLLVKSVEKYTLEYAAEICDVPVDLIREITEIYAKNTPSWIYQGLGQQHYVNGHYSYISAAALAMVTGNLGKSGASCGFCRPRNYYNIGSAFATASAKPGLSITSQRLPELMETGKYGDLEVPLKSIYVYCSNYLGALTDRKRQLEAFMKMELIVVADMTMTDTARYADIILPVTEWAEMDDVHGHGTIYPFLHIQEKAVEPMGEAKSDFEIASLLGARLGYAEDFTASAADYLEVVLGEMYDDLKKNKAIYQPYFSNNGYKYIHGEGGVFPTATRRAQFYLENPGKGFYGELPYGQEIDYSKERLPHWEPPSEAWSENPLFAQYPLSLFQEHVKWRTHTQFSHVPVLRELDPEPIIKISAEDAQSRGINTGDMVKVFNDRGYVVLKAVINNGSRPGMVNIPHGWQEDQFVDGHYSDLTSREMNPIVSNQCYNDCLVEVTKM